KVLLNPFKNWRLSFQYISHKVLRWTLCPLLVPILFLTNTALVYKEPALVYHVFLVLQCAFYGLAFLGWILPEKKRFSRVLLIPYYFVFMNVALYIGFSRFLSGRQSAIWKKAVRKAYP
ncbi:MAG: glycosyltransferase family 2 protein, partial [Bacteroidota bacterium]|nr:glycosyltransferase family 2 protein [Bacteroidota bacterium]